MKIEIKVPAMGESISTATISALLKPSGSTVNADDEIIELETDKVNQVIYAPQKGVISFNAAVGQVVKVGDVIGTLDTEGAQGTDKTSTPATPPIEKAAPATPTVEKAAPAKAAVPEKESSPKPAAPEKPSKDLKKPYEARVAKEAFLEELASTVPVPPKEDVKPKPSEPSVASKPEKRETKRKLPNIRRVIAERLVEVQHTTAMLTTFNEVDMSNIVSLREKYKDEFTKQHGVRLGLMPFFVEASVEALKAFPNFNSYIQGEDIIHRDYFNIGIAVGTEKGVFVPVINDCDKLSFADIEAALEQHAVKAREGTIKVDDLQGGGFTITNGGVYGSLLSTPILNPAQCGILGLHKIVKRPVAIDDEVVIRPMMYLALSYDHRIADGKEAVLFLISIKNYLEDPARLLLKI
jgi:2-oxoglutarate dehydrogenase E2 component (dihydrolipoamide succinyltransferase)